MPIDSHHHFWRYSKETYPDFGQDRSILWRDFLPEDLKSSMDAAGIDGVVTVQSRPNAQDTTWLLELAPKYDFIRGVVGWAPLVSELIGVELEALAKFPKLRGIRHFLQRENEDFFLRDDFNRGLAHLKNFSLKFDLLINENQLLPALRLVDQHPSQIFILDHLAKPKIKDAEMEPWAQHFKQLALRRNVYCKISGMVTEAHWHAWTSRGLKPYFDIALEAFGPRRLMAGSDWPICLVACGYSRWFEILREWAGPLSDGEKERFFGGTAIEAYGLTPAA
jgi:L-fuconolactonase